MLMTLIPLFNDDMAVCAYSIFTQKNNFLQNPSLLGTGQNDGASRIEGLEMIQSIGLQTLSEGKEIFVPVGNISIFSDIENQCSEKHSSVVLLFDNSIPPVEMYINRLRELKEQGFKLAIRKITVADYENYRPIFQLMDYIFLNQHKIALDKAKIYFEKLYPEIKLCAGNIDTIDIFEKLKSNGGYSLYEGNFYRIPVTRGQTEVTPLKANYIALLNIVNNDNFELTKAAEVIGRDTALTLSLLKMVNRMARNSEITSIRHAAAMLGQNELKKWINTAVVNQLYADKPNEITRISLLRAKFAENLAQAFQMKIKADELFLMGLFSVVDVILEKSMEEALTMITVSKGIREALLNKSGEFAPVLSFMLLYEEANWTEVSRLMLLENIDMDIINNAYQDSLRWYREIMSGTN